MRTTHKSAPVNDNRPSPSVRMLMSEAAESAAIFEALAGAPAPLDTETRDQMRAFQMGMSHLASTSGAVSTTAGNLGDRFIARRSSPKNFA